MPVFNKNKYYDTKNLNNKILLIVESPGKISKIQQYLGNDYIIKASCGHVRDLDKNTLSIDIDNNFTPLYKINKDKINIIQDLTNIAKKCKQIILAADGDREGEAIAHSLVEILHINKPIRIIFHEITKSALQNALINPLQINYNMVYAQQTRRLLDRLVGYMISPLLWKYLSNNLENLDTHYQENSNLSKKIILPTVQSAGRVQSITLKIIIDKENEINDSIKFIKPYFKILGNFSLDNFSFSAQIELDIFNCKELFTIINEKDYDKYKIVLFKNEQDIYTFMKLFNNKTIFKIISIYNNIVDKKPGPPFITSSLQQEASTKLHFNVNKTMKIAQKLYEKGYITYMRSDCPNISNDAILEIKQYIIKTFGNEYSNPKNYTSNKSTSQDAHECIRPTHVNILYIPDLSKDENKLYRLIWNKTIASQMTNAIINTKIIKIDAINNNKSILLFKIKYDNIDTLYYIQGYFINTIETIDFLGHLILYTDKNVLFTDNSNNIKKNKKTDFYNNINKNDILNFINLKIIEDYTKLPLRYNEAGLIKCLEKNGIGRPSTYATIISKIINRNYVNIQNINGYNKKSKSYELNKTYIIKERITDICIGKEYNKFVPTNIGLNINKFMINHFSNIINIDFTATFESYLDKIAMGKANWITVLKIFYDMFFPIVDNLNKNNQQITNTNNNDKLLGIINNNNIYIGIGKFGPYVKMFVNNKWKFASLQNINIDTVTVDFAYKLLQFPKIIGTLEKNNVILNKGKYGLYLTYNNINYSIKNIDYNLIDINFAKKIIQNKKI